MICKNYEFLRIFFNRKKFGPISKFSTSTLKIREGALPLLGDGAGFPSNTNSPGLRPTTMPSLMGLRFHPPPGWPKTLSFFVCLYVCLFVRHAFERQRLCTRFHHEGIGVQKQFWCRWIGYVFVQPWSTFWDWCQLATSLNAEVQKTAKIWVFRRQRMTE